MLRRHTQNHHMRVLDRKKQHLQLEPQRLQTLGRYAPLSRTRVDYERGWAACTIGAMDGVVTFDDVREAASVVAPQHGVSEMYVCVDRSLAAATISTPMWI